MLHSPVGKRTLSFSYFPLPLHMGKLIKNEKSCKLLPAPNEVAVSKRSSRMGLTILSRILSSFQGWKAHQAHHAIFSSTLLASSTLYWRRRFLNCNHLHRRTTHGSLGEITLLFRVTIFSCPPFTRQCLVNFQEQISLRHSCQSCKIKNSLKQGRRHSYSIFE